MYRVSFPLQVVVVVSGLNSLQPFQQLPFTHTLHLRNPRVFDITPNFGALAASAILFFGAHTANLAFEASRGASKRPELSWSLCSGAAGHAWWTPELLKCLVIYTSYFCTSLISQRGVFFPPKIRHWKLSASRKKQKQKTKQTQRIFVFDPVLRIMVNWADLYSNQ